MQDEASTLSKIKESETWTDLQARYVWEPNDQSCNKLAMEKRDEKGIAIRQFTESDFVNKNVVDDKLLSRSVPNYFDKFSEKGVFDLKISSKVLIIFLQKTCTRLVDLILAKAF